MLTPSYDLVPLVPDASISDKSVTISASCPRTCDHGIGGLKWCLTVAHSVP